MPGMRDIKRPALKGPIFIAGSGETLGRFS
jgi:hypothetical protein